MAAAPSGKVCDFAGLEAGLSLWFSRVAAVNHADGATQPVLKAKACGDWFGDDAVRGGHEQQLVTGYAMMVNKRKTPCPIAWVRYIQP